MRKQQIFQALVFGFVLAITGCSSDPENGGNGGSGGSTGPVSSCDAICDGPCVLLGVVDPASPDCATECTQATDPDGGLNDECGPEMATLLDCGATANACDDALDLASNCPTEFDTWDDCNDATGTGGSGGTGGMGGTGGSGGTGGTGGTGGGTGGDVIAGLYAGIDGTPDFDGDGNGYAVCFWVANNMIELVDSNACNLRNLFNNESNASENAFELEVDDVGTPGNCDFDIDYESDNFGPVPINQDGTFEVVNLDLGIGTWSFSGTIDGNTASGTASQFERIFDTTCSIDWTATHQ